MKFVNINSLDPAKFMVIDMTTGTVVDCDNLALVASPAYSEDEETLVASDSVAFDYANETGTPLFIKADEMDAVTERAASYEF